MALWYYQRPPDAADSNERLVADALQRLGGQWIIRWGWYFGDAGAPEHREGDFLIYGPGGHVLVLEVKGMAVRTFALTGYWEGDDNRDPIAQLLSQWKAVIAKLQAVGAGVVIPPVHKAFAFPNVPLLPGEKPTGEMAKYGVLGPRQLDEFQNWWAQHVQRGPLVNQCTIELAVPDDKASQTEFYEKELPGYLWLICQNRQIPVRFDALVVDEGQDMDTAFPRTAGCLSSIAHHPLETYPLEDQPPAANGCLRYLSLNRAKGLDFLAVILIDIPDPAAELDVFLFAATRARQLLGVVRGPAS